MSVHVFVGPTLSEAQILAIDNTASVHPPVVHGDLLSLRLRAGDIVVIIDGGYHHTGSVRHKEILSLLASGVRIVGCASMGALRAAELEPYGMIGNGAVFEMYRSGVIDADDEVAVAHGEGPDFRRFNEPLVNIRHALDAAYRAETISAAEMTGLTDYARILPYTARTWEGIARDTEKYSEELSKAVRRVCAFLADHPEHADIKAADALDTMNRLGDITAAREDLEMTWRSSPYWRHWYLYEWTVNFASSRIGDTWVELGSVIRYRQIYDDEFPRRWREFALHQMLSSHGIATEGLAEESLAGQLSELALRMGLDGASLTTAQANEWLLEGEEDLPARVRLLRVLTRSFKPKRGIYDLLTMYPDLVHSDDARRAVAESHVVSLAVESWGPKQSVHHIKESVLHHHLADVWRSERKDVRSLTAAARDRGFTNLRTATAAVRPFYLRHHVRTGQTGK